jgi:hypothetical protein
MFHRVFTGSCIAAFSRASNGSYRRESRINFAAGAKLTSAASGTLGSIRTFAASRFDDRKADADMAGGKDCSQPLADLDFPPVVRRCGNTPGTYRTLAMSRDAATQLPESGY